MTSSSAKFPGALTTEPNRPGASTFIAFEIALEVIVSLRDVVVIVRRHSRKLAEQIEDAASSVAANLAEGSQRQGRDRLHLFRIAAGSAQETRAHLRVALAWGWVSSQQIETAMKRLDRELALTWGLTH